MPHRVRAAKSERRAAETIVDACPTRPTSMGHGALLELFTRASFKSTVGSSRRIRATGCAGAGAVGWHVPSGFSGVSVLSPVWYRCAAGPSVGLMVWRGPDSRIKLPSNGVFAGEPWELVEGALLRPIGPIEPTKSHV
jgi:hypothetical protein